MEEPLHPDEESMDNEDDELQNWQNPSEYDFDEDKKNCLNRGAFTPMKSFATKTNESLHPRCILHIDFDCFYAQVEMIKDQSLKERPLAVFQKHILVSSNYVARALGVKKMSSKAEALKVCPNLLLINGEDLSPYREYSERMFDLLKESSPLVEKVGLDESYIDITSNIEALLKTEKSSDICIVGHCYGFDDEIDMSLKKILENEKGEHCTCGCYLRLALASSFASQIRLNLFKQLGLTSTAGIAHNKILAKLIGKMHKPNQQTTILPTYANEFLSCKKVRDIPGIGSQAAKALQEMDVTIVQHLQDVPKERLVAKFGTKQGEFMKNISYGKDNSDVKPSQNMLKSISEEESFRKLTNFDEVKRQIEILTKKVLLRLERENRLPKTIKLTLRKHFMPDNYSRISRQAPFDSRILDNENIEEKVKVIVKMLVGLFDKMIDRVAGFDLAVINVGFTNFQQRSLSNSISNYFKTCDEVTSLKRNFSSRCTEHGERETKNEFSNSDHEARSSCNTNEELTRTISSGDATNEMIFKQQLQEDAQPHYTSSSSTGCSKKDSPDIIISEYKEKEQLEILQRQGIDPAVFKELPIEVQIELLNDWNQKGKSGHPKIKEPPKKKQKNDKLVKTGNILKYFTK